MTMSDERKRITDQTTDASLSAGDYIIVDSSSEGTRKFDLGSELSDIKQDLAQASGVPTTVRQAIYNLLNASAYASTGHTSDIATVQSWASAVTAISLNKSSTTITGTGTEQLVATTTPSGGTVTWQSSDTSVATVSASGLVTGVSNGTATITASSGGLSATCTVTVSGAVTLSSISASYTQTGTIYDTDTLSAILTAGTLVVTATYDDTSTATIPNENCTLSGSLSVGTSTITVSYGGKTDTFSVAVTASRTYLYNWDFTTSMVDSVSGRTAIVGSSNSYSDPTRGSSGLVFDQPTQYLYLGEISPVGKTFEIDVASFDFDGLTSYHIRFFTNAQYTTSTSKGLGCICWKYSEGWKSYGWTTETGTSLGWSSNFWSSDLTGATSEVINAFDGKTVKVVYHSDGHTKDLYLDGVYEGTIDDIYFNNSGSTHLSDKMFIAGMGSVDQTKGDQCYDMTITGIRIYENNE